MNRDTIRIAGAGLSGLSAAIGLARRGHRVDVFEKNADSGEARRGHWDAMENWTTEEDVLALLRPAGIALEFQIRPMPNIDICAGNGTRYAVSAKRP
ncbi:MAG TPA: FAD-dependent oxidoreductase, partial [Anaerolineae bacterium]